MDKSGSTYNPPGEPGIGSAGQPASDGSMPEPGGWNRFQIMTPDLDAEIKRLESEGTTFKTSINTGAGGRQILLEEWRVLPGHKSIQKVRPRHG